MTGFLTLTCRRPGNAICVRPANFMTVVLLWQAKRIFLKGN
jgi:hypothetical protein